MPAMTTRERIGRMYAHQEADRVPIVDTPWASTIERWHREGMPKDVHFTEFFGIDHIASIHADNSPRFPVKVLEETEDYRIVTSPWGVTLRQWTHAGGVPEFLDFTVTDRDQWQKAKERMVPDADRVDWEHLKRNYARWRKDGSWIMASLWFGFDVTHAWMVGTERLLMAMATDPEWVSDMMNHYLDVHLQLFDMIWDAGYTFDEVNWPDDMGYKQSQFFSVSMYQELVKPVHKRAIDWAHAKGVKVRLHSCGDIRPFIPDFAEMGVDMLNPLEVKAGVDPLAVKRQYGDQLAFHGGLNAVLFEEPTMDAMRAEMQRVVPVMKEGGGYILGSDHSVPDSVSVQQFQQFVEEAKQVGSYE